MFAIVQGIYGLDIRARADVETWHSDVDFYEIYDRGGSLRGGFTSTSMRARTNAAGLDGRMHRSPALAERACRSRSRS